MDSTGVKLCGPGEWLVEKHGVQRQRAWKKLHIGLDAASGRVVAATLTDHDVDDGSQVGALLDQVEEPLACFIADGAYDQTGVTAAVAGHTPDAAVVVPPRSTAVPSANVETYLTQRLGTSSTSPSTDAWPGKNPPGTTSAPWSRRSSAAGNASSATPCGSAPRIGGTPRSPSRSGS